MMKKKKMWNDGLVPLAPDDALPPVATRHICYGGGGGGSPTPTQNSQNSTTTSGPNPNIASGLGTLAGNIASKIGDAPPDFYSRPLVADPSDLTRQSWDAAGALGGGEQGRAAIAPTLNGAFLNLRSNPYFQDAITASLEPATANFFNSVVPKIRSQAASAGRPGSGAEGAMLQQAFGDFTRGNSDAAVKAGAQMFDSERNRQMQAASFLPGFMGMDLSRIGALREAGAGKDAYNQNLINADVARDTYDKTKWLDYWSDLAARLQASYPGGQTTGMGSSMGQTAGGGGGGSNMTGSLISGGMGLAGAAITAAAMM